MKKYFISILLLLIWNEINAQVDSFLSPVVHRNSGIYAEYEEYIRNTPSIKEQFIVKELPPNKFDSLKNEVQLVLKDSTKKYASIWGFRDGQFVYVCYPQNKAKRKRFWKVEGDGKVPFFTYDLAPKPIEGDILKTAILPVSALIVTTIMDDLKNPYGLRLITKEGKFKEVTLRSMKKLLKNRPVLLKSFEQACAEYDKYETLDYGGVIPEDIYPEVVQLMRTYLIKFNEGN